jgi:hypothetical protein
MPVDTENNHDTVDSKALVQFDKKKRYVLYFWPQINFDSNGDSIAYP